jgi:hypothetical protein
VSIWRKVIRSNPTKTIIISVFVKGRDIICSCWTCKYGQTFCPIFWHWLIISGMKVFYYQTVGEVSSLPCDHWSQGQIDFCGHFRVWDVTFFLSFDSLIIFGINVCYTKYHKSISKNKSYIPDTKMHPKMNYLNWRSKATWRSWLYITHCLLVAHIYLNVK